MGGHPVAGREGRRQVVGGVNRLVPEEMVVAEDLDRLGLEEEACPEEMHQVGVASYQAFRGKEVACRPGS